MLAKSPAHKKHYKMLVVIMLPVCSNSVHLKKCIPISGNGRSILGFARPCPHPVYQYILSSLLFKCIQNLINFQASGRAVRLHHSLLPISHRVKPTW